MHEGGQIGMLMIFFGGYVVMGLIYTGMRLEVQHITSNCACCMMPIYEYAYVNISMSNLDARFFAHRVPWVPSLLPLHVHVHIRPIVI